MPAMRTNKRGRWGPDAGMSNSHKRGPWSCTEDDELRRLVSEKGAGKWVQIADVLQTRSPKQCRERWHQNLKPDLNHEPITEEEGRQIEQLVHQLGKKWADIARHLDSRSDNAVKNWWNGGENRRKREQARANEARMHSYHAGFQGGSYPMYREDAHLFERPVLPPIQKFNHPMSHVPAPVAVPDHRQHIDPAEPSPLSARPPSLVSDVGSEPVTYHAGHHSHRSSFNLPTPQLGCAVDMYRSISNESQWSPMAQPHTSYRISNARENNAICRTGIVHEAKQLPALDHLTIGNSHQKRPEAPPPTAGPSAYNISPSQQTMSPAAQPSQGQKQEPITLPPLIDRRRLSGSPEEGKARMSVNSIIS